MMYDETLVNNATIYPNMHGIKNCYGFDWSDEFNGYSLWIRYGCLLYSFLQADRKKEGKRQMKFEICCTYSMV